MAGKAKGEIKKCPHMLKLWWWLMTTMPNETGGHRSPLYTCWLFNGGATLKSNWLFCWIMHLNWRKYAYNQGYGVSLWN